MIIDKNILNILPLGSPAGFAAYVSSGNWKCAKHLAFINAELMKIFSKPNGKLILNMPPRHGKSEFISKYLPAWYLCRFPSKRVILTSYETSFAVSWGRKVRNIINETGDDFGIGIDKSKKSVSEFIIENYGGSLNCIGAGGAITGKGADLIIIDDPVKNDEEANSPTMRDNIWEWFRSTVFTRLEPGGHIVLIMTRWHHDDLCGRIINSDEYKSWRHINLPAIAKEDDILKRTAGAALWSNRYNIHRLGKIRNTIGSHWFEALYQQNPTPSEGSIFHRKNFRYFTMDKDKYILYDQESSVYLSKRYPVYCCVDLAATKSEMSDYTAIITFTMTKNNEILILDIIRERFDSSEHLQLITNHYYKWKPNLIGIESVQYQISLVKSLSAKGIPVKKLSATKDKVSRALSIAAKSELGEIYFLKDAHWLTEFEKELLEFPAGKHDDQVDAFAYITQMINPGKSFLPVSNRRTSITSGF